MQEQKRPTLEQLREESELIWRLEVIHTKNEAQDRELWDIAREADKLDSDREITPEKVIAVREKLDAAVAELHGKVVQRTAEMLIAEAV